MPQKKPVLEIETVRRLLENNLVNEATMFVTIYGENCRQMGIDPCEGVEVREVYNELYKTCIATDQLDCYALIYQSTGYVPHGTIIQPMFDKVLETFGPLVKKGELSMFHKEILWRFIELSLEAYDKMHSFQVFFSEFREYVPFHLIPKALRIANELGDKRTLELIQENFLQPPKEFDRSPSGED